MPLFREAELVLPRCLRLARQRLDGINIAVNTKRIPAGDKLSTRFG
jgi:hypothetical protein